MKRTFQTAVFGTALLAVSQVAMAADGGDAPTIKWKSDVRVRHEFKHQEGSIPVDYQWTRLMFRLGGLVTLNPTSDIEFRVATGDGRSSTNHTFGTSSVGFENILIRLDRAYWNWHGIEGFNAYAGRVKNTYYTAGGSDLIWDTDLNFDGAAVSYGLAIPGLNPYINLGTYWLTQNNTQNKHDNLLLAAQIGVKPSFAGIDVGVGAAIYQFTHTNGQPVYGAAKGNSSSSSLYTADYHLLNVGAEVGTKLGELPVAVVGDFVTNRAVDAEDLGYLVGLKVGKTKKAQDWFIGYDYRVLERDAVIGAFTDGDMFNDGGTNGRGHRVKLAYMPTDSIILATAGYLGATNIATGQTELDRNKVQLDVTFMF